MSVTSGVLHEEPSIFERGAPGRRGVAVPDAGAAAPAIPERLLRRSAPLLPEVSELETVRHFTRLSRMNYGVDVGLYPLGSCTMKYNPRACEDAAAMAGFADLHPYAPASASQGALEVMWELERALVEISGMSAVTLLPAAGAHGELAGLKVIRKALSARGDARKKVLIPDTAHGTNPASVALNGWQAVEVKSNADGILDPSAVAAAMADDVAGIMITNPNTLGLFEGRIFEVSQVVHAKGGLVYGDGANLNAILGKYRPACLGIDVIQFNLHKTFSTPHGGGGPGSGPVGVAHDLVRFLPVPRVVRGPDGMLSLSDAFPDSIGRVRSFAGQFLVMVRALAYIRGLGPEGLARVAERAVLNANYVRARLAGRLHLPYPGPCMHEAVFSDKVQGKAGVTTMDMAKRLMDKGFHPPTVYFPLIVHGAIMIEPTETEDKQSIDEFVAAMEAIVEEAATAPDGLHAAPSLTPVSRPDEVEAARRPVLAWKPGS
ncbi:MAG: aminomethyl-transferring glycine dehydrogenase subunit GcvPB [Deltaproteobacteria bacterium]|nr:aminomethyl-transferring glycine dehydrogenase subunit GcvPB [Deltaproteobacteria bacterium]